MKKLTIYACESDLTTLDDLEKIISGAAGWKTLPPDENTPDAGFRFQEADEGSKKRIGNYDMPNDEIEWEDGTTSALFDCDSDDYIGESLMEMLDVTTLIWAEDEDGIPVVYTEL